MAIPTPPFILGTPPPSSHPPPPNFHHTGPPCIHLSNHSPLPPPPGQVINTPDVMDMMSRGARNRHSAETKMNERSSRSHQILTVIVDSQNRLTGVRTHGCLHLVDLAGSERVGKSEATGVCVGWVGVSGGCAHMAACTWWTWRAQRGWASLRQQVGGWGG